MFRSFFNLFGMGGEESKEKKPDPTPQIDPKAAQPSKNQPENTFSPNRYPTNSNNGNKEPNKENLLNQYGDIVSNMAKGNNPPINDVKNFVSGTIVDQKRGNPNPNNYTNQYINSPPSNNRDQVTTTNHQNMMPEQMVDVKNSFPNSTVDQNIHNSGFNNYWDPFGNSPSTNNRDQVTTTNHQNMMPNQMVDVKNSIPNSTVNQNIPPYSLDTYGNSPSTNNWGQSTKTNHQNMMPNQMVDVKNSTPNSTVNQNIHNSGFNSSYDQYGNSQSTVNENSLFGRNATNSKNIVDDPKDNVKANKDFQNSRPINYKASANVTSNQFEGQPKFPEIKENNIIVSSPETSIITAPSINNVVNEDGKPTNISLQNNEQCQKPEIGKIPSDDDNIRESSYDNIFREPFWPPLERNTRQYICPVHLYAYTNDIKKLEELLENGADVNQKHQKMRFLGFDMEGATPLHFASLVGNITAVQMLHSKGCNLKETTNQFIPQLPIVPLFILLLQKGWKKLFHILLIKKWIYIQSIKLFHIYLWQVAPSLCSTQWTLFRCQNPLKKFTYKL